MFCVEIVLGMRREYGETRRSSGEIVAGAEAVRSAEPIVYVSYVFYVVK